MTRFNRIHKASPEYDLYKAVATYLRLQYPYVLYHFDPTGLSLTKTQAGKLKAIQGGSGYPDLFIMEPKGRYHGLFIEIKPEGTRLRKKNGEPASDHIFTQFTYCNELRKKGYHATVCVGYDEIKKIIDKYMNQ